MRAVAPFLWFEPILQDIHKMKRHLWVSDLVSKTSGQSFAGGYVSERK